MTETLRIAMIGHGFMGAAHSQGWRVAPHFFDLPLEPEMSVVVGRNAATVEASARKWGWAESATDWREVIAYTPLTFGVLSQALFFLARFLGPMENDPYNTPMPGDVELAPAVWSVVDGRGNLATVPGALVTF